jgi:trehalose synthase
MVAGRAGGIVDQIKDGETGYLVDSVEMCAERCSSILTDPDHAHAMALKGKEHVRRNFLSPRLLRDWLALFNRLDGNEVEGADLVTAGAA